MALDSPSRTRYNLQHAIVTQGSAGMKRAWLVAILLCLGQGLFAIPSALADGSTMDLRPWGHVDTPGTALDIFVDADLADVADYEGGLRIIDISQPAAPREIGYNDTSGHTESVVITGPLAYIADYEGGLRIIDVSRPQHPEPVATFDTPGWARDVTLQDSVVYIADREAGLLMLDISMPDTPSFVAGYDTPGWARRVTLLQGLAHVADGQEGLRVISISRSDIRGGGCDTAGWARDVAVLGSVAYVADGWMGLAIVDVSDPDLPQPLAQYDTPGDAYALTLDGPTAYVADGDRGLRVLDIGDPERISELAHYDTDGEARGVILAGGLIYVADGTSGLLILRRNVSEVALPIALGGSTSAGARPDTMIGPRIRHQRDREDSMNTRERFMATMRFQPVDRLPKWEMGYWAGTVERWHSEGLPRHPDAPRGLVAGAGVKGEGFPWRQPEIRDLSVRSFFEFDPGIEKVAGEWGVFPYFQRQTLAEDEETITQRDVDGTTAQVRKDNTSLPHVIDWPVKGRTSWQALKRECLQPDTPGRFPSDWPRLLRHYQQRNFPLVLGGPFLGVFSALRTLFGFEQLMYAFYDQPDLIDDILSHLTDLWLALFEEVLAQTDVDYAYYWEDMSYKSGPMVSPRIFRRFLAPAYRRINDFFGGHGIDTILVDTDGDVWELIPLFLEVGVTGLYPFEVRAGMDVAQVRKAYPRLQMLGGIDKTAIAAGPEAIDREMERIAPVVRSGGYIPGCDHYVSPDVPWEHFCYYRDKLTEITDTA